jgi:hypothetical protein
MNRKTNKKSKQKSNETGVGKKPSPEPTRVNTRLHRESPSVANYCQNLRSPTIDLHHQKFFLIKNTPQKQITDKKKKKNKKKKKKKKKKHS